MKYYGLYAVLKEQSHFNQSQTHISNNKFISLIKKPSIWE